jgi:hypothetical protein
MPFTVNRAPRIKRSDRAMRKCSGLEATFAYRPDVELPAFGRNLMAGEVFYVSHQLPRFLD